MKAVAFGEDGLAGDSGFDPATNVLDLDKDQQFDDLMDSWLTLVAKEDFDIDRIGTNEWLGTREWMNGKLDRDGLAKFIEDNLGLKPVGFWVLEDQDLETIHALRSVECCNDSAAYTVNRCMKTLCHKLAQKIVASTNDVLKLSES